MLPSNKTSARLAARALVALLLFEGPALSALADSGGLVPRKEPWFDVADLATEAANAARAVGEAWSVGWVDAADGLAKGAAAVPARLPDVSLWPVAVAELASLSDDAAGKAEPAVDPAWMRDQVSGSKEPPAPKARGPVRDAGPSERALFADWTKSGDPLASIPLLTGWNLISLPETPADASPAAVFGAVAGVEGVHAFDACDAADPWKVWHPADPEGSDLTAIDVRRGYWVQSASTVDVPADGVLAAVTEIPLCPGWNLIGFPSRWPRSVEGALASIAGKYLRVYGFDAADMESTWAGHDVAVPEWANDLDALEPGKGYWVLATEATTLRIANEGADPEVALLAPADLGTVTTFTDVVGTVRSELLDHWTLTVREVGSEEGTEIARGVAPVEAGVLGRFDPTLLQNGLYELKLTALDLAGLEVEESIAVVVEGGLKLGLFTLSFVDLAIPVSGLDLEIVRTYDSRARGLGDFGHGWTLDVRQGSYRNNRKPGDGWQILEGFLPCDSVQETKSHLTTIRLSDREIYRFRAKLVEAAPTLGGCFARADFDFVDGPVPGARLEITTNATAFYENASNRVIDTESFVVYEPKGVRMTTRDGRVFDFDLEDGVTAIADPNGNRVTISAAGIQHTAGIGIEFERDGAGRIVRIADVLGNPNLYAYDANGDLVGFTDRGGNATLFAYAKAHYLRDVIDPRGVRAVRSEYDADGRLVKVTDAAGKPITIQHDLATTREVVTDRLGNVRVMEYDNRGNVVRETDPTGAITTRTFDGEDNLLSETDPLGNTTVYTYSTANDLLSARDPLGNSTTFTYDPGGRVLTTTDPRGNVTQSSYDEQGNLTSTNDSLGAVNLLTHDASGNLLTETDALGGVNTLTYDSRGSVLSHVDPLGVATTFTYDGLGNRLTETTSRMTPSGAEALITTNRYDPLGRLIETTMPDGATSRTVYDALGVVVESIDALGRPTRFTYDERGRQTAGSFPDGTGESRAYDEEGRLVAWTDRGGRVTSYAYDAVGRPLATTYADGAVARSTYDSAGRLIAATDPRNYTTRYEYDAAGRRVRTVDPLGNAAAFGYDSAGYQVEFADAAGNRTLFEVDAAGRTVRTVFADGTSRRANYDGLGRLVGETDQAGASTQFEYDPVGRLARVVDALSGATEYRYDELGNRVAQVDANGHVTLFAFDAVGRELSRTLPDGAVQYRMYDHAGNEVASTDYLGRTTGYVYDDADRMVERVNPDASRVIFTYTASGQRASVIDARGTTTYRYDARERLTELTYPDGRRLTHVYDLAGNRTELTAHLAGAVVLRTGFSWDASNRLATVTDATGRTYRHSYDGRGTRTALDHPNGVRTSYSYDTLGRLRHLATSRIDTGTTIQSYSLALGATGNRVQVEEGDGLSRSYAYDALYRLTREEVNASSGLVYRNEFSYDAVGNRRQRSSTYADGATASVASDYDVRDRLVSAGGAPYTWDAAGRLASRGADVVRWSADDRLLEAVLADGTTVRHSYDPDGVLIRTEAESAAGTTALVDYLVDTSGPLSHVIAETDEAGKLVAHYVRGDDLLAVVRPAATRYCHADGVGSIRALTNGTGAITDRYSFDAFGMLVQHVGGDPNAFLFAGERLDPNTSFAYHRARWLDPSVGRFVSMDRFPGLDSDPRTLHQYAYAFDNPVDYSDPTGLTSLGESIQILSVQAMMLAVRLPALRAAVGIVAAILIPEEFQNALQGVSGPWGQVGIVAQGEVRFFGLVKGRAFRAFVNGVSQRLTGRLWREVGDRFEDVLARYFLKGAQRQVVVEATRRIRLDFLWKGILLEVKTSRRLEPDDVEQLLAAAKYAKANSVGLSYMFLIKPTRGTIAQITAAGGKVVWFFDF